MSARFLWLDVRATLGERKTLLAAGLMAYTVLAVPFLVAKPPEHIMMAMGTWFGASEPFTLFLYLWTDLAMNKLVVILGLVLAGGMVTRERETGVLAVLLSKPVSPARYFLARALSACAVMGLLYVVGHLVAAPLAARSVPGFRAGMFFASMAVHLFAAFFCVCLCALMSVLVPKRSLAALVSLLVLFSLVGSSFIGIYNPAWRELALVNPFAHGVAVVTHLTELRPGHVLGSIAVLLGFNVALLALGAVRVRNLEV